MAVPILSQFTYHANVSSWDHLSDGDPLYVLIKDINTNDIDTCTFGAQSLTEQAAIFMAGGNFHTLRIWSLVDPIPGTHEIAITGGGAPANRVVSFNIANGPIDAQVTAIVGRLTAVTTHAEIYGLGYEENDLLIAWFDTFGGGFAASVNDGTPLFEGTEFAIAYKYGDGGKTRFDFAFTDLRDQMIVCFAIPSGSQRVSHGARQVWLGVTNGLSTSGLNSFPLPHADRPNTEIIGCPLPIPGTLRHVFLKLKTPPGGGKSRTFAICKEGVPIAELTGTISGTDTELYFDGIEKPLYRFSAISLAQLSVSGAPAASSELEYCMEFETADAGLSVYGPGVIRGSSLVGGVGAANRKNLFGPISDASNWSTQPYDAGRVGVEGAIIGLLFMYPKQLSESILEAYVWKSVDDGQTYIRQGSSLMTLTGPLMFNVSDVNGSDFWYFPIPPVGLGIGDQAYGEVIATHAGPHGTLNFAMNVMMVFRATVNGEFNIDGETQNSHITSYDVGQNAVQNPLSEAAAEIHLGPLTSPFRIGGITWGVHTPPGLGQSRSFGVRKNGVTVVAATIADSDHGADAEAVVTYAEGDAICVQPGEAWTTQVAWNTAWWALKGFLQPARAIGGTIGPLAWVHWPRRIP